MPSPRNSLLLISAALLLALPLAGRRVKLHHDLKGRETAIQAPDGRFTTATDTLAAVRCFGYDKPLSANKESLFLTSPLDSDTIVAVQLRLTYKTPSGQLLHERDVDVVQTIAPRATVRLQFKSWDATNTFYYFKTPPRKAENYTPYKVTVTPLRIQLK